MTRSPWVRAAIVCLSISAVLSFVGPMFFGDGVRYMPDVDWSRVDSMTYADAIKYINERSQRISSWEAFRDSVKYRHYWLDRLYVWLLMAGFGFVCCAAFIFWLDLHRAPSNPTPHTDARDVPASANDSGARAGGRER